MGGTIIVDHGALSEKAPRKRRLPRLALLAAFAMTGLALISASSASACCISGSTGKATEITGRTATLNGSLFTGTETRGQQVVAGFEYGLTKTYGQETEGEVLQGEGGYYASTHQRIMGLQPNTTYHFRIVVVGEGQVTHGNDSTFTTTALQPIGVYGAFTAERYPATLTGVQTAAHPFQFTVNSRVLTCEEVTYSASLLNSGTPRSLGAAYGKCTGFGLPATVAMNRCSYGIGSMALTISCAEPSEAIEIVVGGGACHVDLAPQEAKGGVGYTTIGEGTGRKIEAEFVSTPLQAKVTGGQLTCGTNGARQAYQSGHIIFSGTEA